MSSVDSPSESRLVKVWQHQRLDGGLVTEEGEPLTVIYPGRINDDRGADLRDAVIGTSRGLVKGDIEVHVKSSNWQAHRHHLDAAYNGVILHVVFRRDSDVTTSLQNGRRVPTLALESYMKRRPERLSDRGMLCQRAARRRDIAIGEFLDKAGDERFLAKAAGFRADLAQTAAAQVLYQGIMAALGYAKNKLPCLELAHRLPLSALESVPDALDEARLLQQQALLLGTAGLLPSQRSDQSGTDRGDGWVDGLERRWASSHQKAVMSEHDWHLFKVRPNNLPQRRLVALSYLLVRYRDKGILEGLIGRLRGLSAESASELEKTLMVVVDGYWAGHFDFGLPSPRPAPTLVGEARAADIVVNALLPFAFAWGGAEAGLANQAIDLYRGYPRLAPNSVERHMRRQLGLDGRLVNSARRQQGLLHLYRTRCAEGGCDHCPLGGRVTG